MLASTEQNAWCASCVLCRESPCAAAVSAIHLQGATGAATHAQHDFRRLRTPAWSCAWGGSKAATAAAAHGATAHFWASVLVTLVRVVVTMPKLTRSLMIACSSTSCCRALAAAMLVGVLTRGAAARWARRCCARAYAVVRACSAPAPSVRRLRYKFNEGWLSGTQLVAPARSAATQTDLAVAGHCVWWGSADDCHFWQRRIDSIVCSLHPPQNTRTPPHPTQCCLTRAVAHTSAGA